MSGYKIDDGLTEVISGKAANVTAKLVTDIRTAQRLARIGYRYVWEMDGGRPTGRCIVTIPSEANEGKHGGVG